ncbi:MAG: hypothetical protein LBS03_02080 [Bacteroidales bacterium]|jgi:hypothetical protein|nr:hypothetical protein [Bacteroidales bacterium]
METPYQKNTSEPTDTESGNTNTSYLKVILIFIVAMAALLFGLNHMFKQLL